MKEKTKYYPFRDTPVEYLGEYYTNNKCVYLQAQRIKHLDLFISILGVFWLLSIFGWLVCIITGLTLWMFISIGVFIFTLILVHILDARSNRAWTMLASRAENLPEIISQMRLDPEINTEEEILAYKKELENIENERLFKIAKHIVSIYSTLDDKRLNKTTKTKRVVNQLKEVKENLENGL